ncbi:MAG: hypothetical protein ACKVPJ_02300 [Chitinophagales bacterium]
MNFNPNLGFDEIMYRYAIMIAVGITIGVLQIYWAIPIMMIIFLTGMLGYCPIKEFMLSRKQKSIVVEKDMQTKRHQTIQHEPMHA